MVSLAEMTRVSHDANLMCPGCGSNRPERALILCRTCWSKLPQYIQLEVMETRRKDPKSMKMGEGAIKLMVALGKAQKAKT